MSVEPTFSLHARDGGRLGVRPLDAGDAVALRRFNAGLSAATRSLFLPHAYDEITLARHIERSRRGRDRAYLAFDEDGAVAGYAFLWEFDQSVPLLGVGLADSWQGRGLGEPLMQRLIDDARTAGCAGIELTTLPTNERAFRLYRRVGFESIGEVKNVAGDGRVVRELRMFLALRPGARPLEREFRPPEESPEDSP